MVQHTAYVLRLASVAMRFITMLLRQYDHHDQTSQKGVTTYDMLSAEEAVAMQGTRASEAPYSI